MAGLLPMGFSRYGGSFKREQSKFQGKDLEIYFPPSLWSTDASFQNHALLPFPALTFDGKKDYRIKQLSETIIDKLGFHKFRVVRHREQE